MEDNFDLLASQLVYLQGSLTHLELRDKAKKFKHKLRGLEDAQKSSYLNKHFQEIVNEGQFIRLMDLFDKNSSMLKLAYDSLIEKVKMLQQESSDNQVIMDCDSSTFIKQVPLILNEAEKSENLSNICDDVYTRIINLRKAEAMAVVKRDKLREAMKIVVRIKELEDKL